MPVAFIVMCEIYNYKKQQIYIGTEITKVFLSNQRALEFMKAKKEESTNHRLQEYVYNYYIRHVELDDVMSVP